MSSSYKTPNLKLNLWDGSDKPKRADFNYDNETLDSIIGTHLADSVAHMTADERAKWNAPFVVGSYHGNGANTRVIPLDFTPSFIIVYANHMPWSLYDSSGDKLFSFGGISTVLYSSAGLALTENTLTVTETPNSPIHSNCYPRMNTSGYRYQYIAFK